MLCDKCTDRLQNVYRAATSYIVGYDDDHVDEDEHYRRELALRNALAQVDAVCCSVIYCNIRHKRKTNND